MQTTEQDVALANLIAKRFIQRKDVKAIQVGDGGYRPVREPWKMKDLIAHVQRTQTFGHYTVDQDSMTKLLVFDIDLDTGLCEKYKAGTSRPPCCSEGHGTWVETPGDEWLAQVISDHEFMDGLTIHPIRPREEWRNRRSPARDWLKYQLRQTCDMLTSGIQNHLGLESVAAYSGNKGCHVYGFFPKPVDARTARKAALLTLEYAGKLIGSGSSFEPYKGTNFFKHTEEDPYYNLKNLTVEIFPKQASMSDKDLGSLVRLPLGTNQKSPDPCFLIDQRLPVTELKPHPDPVALLTSGDPFKSGGNK